MGRSLAWRWASSHYRDPLWAHALDSLLEFGAIMWLALTSKFQVKYPCFTSRLERVNKYQRKTPPSSLYLPRYPTTDNAPDEVCWRSQEEETLEHRPSDHLWRTHIMNKEQTLMFDHGDLWAGFPNSEVWPILTSKLALHVLSVRLGYLWGQFYFPFSKFLASASLLFISMNHLWHHK